MKRSPAFQYYPKDFESDEHVKLMTLEEIGAYTLLMGHCWVHESLPGDAAALARICGKRTTAAKMDRMWHQKISKCFIPHENGRWTHPRLDHEREKQSTYRQRQSDKRAAFLTMKAKLASSEVSAEPPTSYKPAHSLLSSDCNLQTAVSTEKKTSRAPKEPSPAREFLEWFQGEFQRRRGGAKYFVSWEKHMPIIGRLQKGHSSDRLKNHARILLSTNEDWIATTDRGIEVLASKINWLEEKLVQFEKDKARAQPAS